MNFLKKLFPILVVLLFSFFAFRPLLASGFFPIHDNTQVARVFEMTKALRDGMFPVRWSQDLGFGYGYPMFNFYNPLPYYIAGLLSLTGIDALAATKIMMILGIVIAGISMYFLAKEFWGELGAVLSALFYTYAPYHAVDIYVRGDVAEFWAYAFIPLTFYGFWKLYKEKKWRYAVIASLSYAAITISHNLTAFMATPFIALFVFYLLLLIWKKEKKVDKYLILAFLLGLLISAFYWLPAIFEIGYTNTISQIQGGADFRNNFACLNELWSGNWGYGGSFAGCNKGLSLMIGKYHILIAFLVFLASIAFLCWDKFSDKFKEELGKLHVLIFAFIAFLLVAFLTLAVSDFIWEAIKPMAYLQYPWRFLVMASFFSSFMCGALLWMFNKFIDDNLVNYAIGILAFSLIVAASIKFFVPQMLLNKNASDYTNPYALEWVTSNITSEFMPQNFQKPKAYNLVANFSEISTKTVTVSGLTRKTQSISFNVNAKKQSVFAVPLAYFPAWQATLNGQNIKVIQNNIGIGLNVPAGKYIVKLYFVQTPVEILGDLLSVVGILLLFTGIIHLRLKYER